MSTKFINVNEKYYRCFKRKFNYFIYTHILLINSLTGIIIIYMCSI